MEATEKTFSQKKRNRVRDFFFQKGIYAPHTDGDGGNWTRVRVCKPSTSTSLVMRGSCREKVAALQASFPYSD